MRKLLLVGLVTACGTRDSPAPPPPAPAPKPAVAAFPALETSCTTDADCTTTGRWSTCCGVCEQKYASKAYVAKVDAFCTANPAVQCPGMGCSWGMAKVRCVEGTCRASPR
ncbi:MAG: hypothetical protein H0T46_16735 [Deltaproteobacteria bacterium]|nr:hypothetical protein [Deltaproteobacteria bacterium]